MNGARECERRRKQIAAGSLKKENGLVGEDVIGAKFGEVPAAA